MQKLLQDANIGQNLQRLRRKRKISQYDMVKLLEEMGRSMSRASYRTLSRESATSM